MTDNPLKSFSPVNHLNIFSSHVLSHAAYVFSLVIFFGSFVQPAVAAAAAAACCSYVYALDYLSSSFN
jgi:hypothetical protein